MNSDLKQMLKISKAVFNAYKLLDITVENVNEDAFLDAANAIDNNIVPVLFGVKNSKAIGRKYINNLTRHKAYIWNTIDKMSDGGRAADMMLNNPLTGKIMTGSSSATAVNVLYGINDAGICSDGGGSVLAPALSLNLYSIMAKGMGLNADYSKKSTDGIDFTAGIGVISHSLKVAADCIYKMGAVNLENYGYSDDGKFNEVRIAVPHYKNIILPTGEDMRKCLDKTVCFMKENGAEVYEEDFPDFNDRRDSIKKVKKLLERYDVLITFEGPVDFEGLGDSVFGNMGSFAKEMQLKSGKYIVKIANMVGATAVTIPADEAASGIVMVCGEGIYNGIRLIHIAEKLSAQYVMPETYVSYFKNSYLRRKNDFIFSTDGDEDL